MIELDTGHRSGRETPRRGAPLWIATAIGAVILGVAYFLYGAGPESDPYSPRIETRGPLITLLTVAFPFIVLILGGMFFLLRGLVDSETGTPDASRPSAGISRADPPPVADPRVTEILHTLQEVTSTLRDNVRQFENLHRALPHLPPGSENSGVDGRDPARDAEAAEAVRLRTEGARALLRCASMGELFSAIMDTGARMTGARRASIFLRDDSELLALHDQRGLGDLRPGEMRIPLHEGVMGKVIARGRGYHVRDVSSDPEFGWRNKNQYTTGAFISIPVRTRDDIAAVLNLSNPSAGVFRPEGYDELRSFLEESILAVENLILRRNILERS